MAGIGANSISENFDGLALGDINGKGSYAHASAWSTSGTGGSCECFVYNYGNSHGYTLVVTDNEESAKAKCGLSLDSGYQSESGYIQVGYYHPVGGETSYFGLQSSSSDADWICGVGLNYTNYIRGNVGAGWFDITSWGANTWYTVKIVFDVEAETAAFYVGGALLTTKTLLGSTNAVTHIVFTTPTSQVGTAHFDDFVFAGDSKAAPDPDPPPPDPTNYSESGSETLLLGDVGIGSAEPGAIPGANVPAETDFRYYLGSYDGKVYLEHPDYFHDNNETIPVHLITKVTDFSEENPRAHNKYKTVYFVRLWYIDKSADISVTFSISNDEGTNWTTNTKTLGSGSGLHKSADFFYPISGHTFQFKVENNSADKDFQWIGLEAFYVIGGEYFEV